MITGRESLQAKIGTEPRGWKTLILLSVLSWCVRCGSRHTVIFKVMILDIATKSSR